MPTPVPSPLRVAPTTVGHMGGSLDAVPSPSPSDPRTKSVPTRPLQPYFDLQSPSTIAASAAGSPVSPMTPGSNLAAAQTTAASTTGVASSSQRPLAMYQQPAAQAAMHRSALQRASPRSRGAGLLPSLMDDDDSANQEGRGATSAAAAAVAASSAAAVAAEIAEGESILASAATAEQLSTAPMLEARRALRSHPQILQWIEVFWRTFPAKASVGISKEQYLAQHALMYKALHPTYDPVAAHAAGQVDWARDVWFSASPHYLDADAFGDALFEVADLWTLTVDPQEYIHFLASLYHRITDLRSWIAPAPSSAIVTKFMWRRLRQVAPAPLNPYAPFAGYRSVTKKDWKEAVDVAHLIDDSEGQAMKGSKALALAQRHKLFAGGMSAQQFEANEGAMAGATGGDDSDDEDGKKRSGKNPSSGGGDNVQQHLDPTQILSLLPVVPTQPPEEEFLSPPAAIPAQPHQPMFSDPLRELGLVVLNTAEDDAPEGDENFGADWGDEDAEDAETAQPAAEELAWGAAAPAEGTKAAAGAAAGGGKKKPPPGKKPGGATAGGKKKPLPGSSAAAAAAAAAAAESYEPTQAEIDAFLASNPAGLSLPPKGTQSVGARDAQLKVLLLGQARTILKQRKRDEAIALAGQIRARIEAASGNGGSNAGDGPQNEIVGAKQGIGPRSSQGELNKSVFAFEFGGAAGGAGGGGKNHHLNVGLPGRRASITAGGGGGGNSHSKRASLSAEEIARRRADHEAGLAEEAERQARAREEQAALDAEAAKQRQRQAAYEESLLPQQEQMDRAYLRDELPLTRTIEEPLLDPARRTKWHGHSKRYSFLSPQGGKHAPITPHKAAIAQARKRSVMMAPSFNTGFNQPLQQSPQPQPQQQQPQQGTWSAMQAPQRPRACSWPPLGLSASRGESTTSFAALLAAGRESVTKAAAARKNAAGSAMKSGQDASSSSSDDEESAQLTAKASQPPRRPTSGGSSRSNISGAGIAQGRRPSIMPGGGGLGGPLVSAASSASSSLAGAKRSLLLLSPSTGLGLSSKPPPFLAIAALKELQPSTGFTSRQKTKGHDLRVTVKPIGTRGRGAKRAQQAAALPSVAEGESSGAAATASDTDASTAGASAAVATSTPAAVDEPATPQVVVPNEVVQSAAQEIDDFLVQLDASRLRARRPSRIVVPPPAAPRTPPKPLTGSLADLAPAVYSPVHSRSASGADGSWLDDDDANADGSLIEIDPSALDLVDLADQQQQQGVRFPPLSFDDIASDDEDDEDESAETLLTSRGMTGNGSRSHAGCPSPSALRLLDQYRRLDSLSSQAHSWEWGLDARGKQRLIISLPANTWDKAWYAQAKGEKEELDAVARKKEKEKKRRAKRKAKAAAAKNKGVAGGATMSKQSKSTTFSAELVASMNAAAAAAAALSSPTRSSQASAPMVDFDDVGDEEAALALLSSQDWEQHCLRWGAKFEKGWKAPLGKCMAAWSLLHAAEEERRAREMGQAAGESTEQFLARRAREEAEAAEADRAFWTAISSQEAQRRMDKALQMQQAAVIAAVTEPAPPPTPTQPTEAEAAAAALEKKKKRATAKTDKGEKGEKGEGKSSKRKTGAAGAVASAIDGALPAKEPKQPKELKVKVPKGGGPKSDITAASPAVTDGSTPAAGPSSSPKLKKQRSSSKRASGMASPDGDLSPTASTGEGDDSNMSPAGSPPMSPTLGSIKEGGGGGGKKKRSKTKRNTATIAADGSSPVDSLSPTSSSPQLRPGSSTSSPPIASPVGSPKGSHRKSKRESGGVGGVKFASPRSGGGTEESLTEQALSELSLSAAALPLLLPEGNEALGDVGEGGEGEGDGSDSDDDASTASSGSGGSLHGRTLSSAEPSRGPTPTQRGPGEGETEEEEAEWPTEPEDEIEGIQGQAGSGKNSAPGSPASSLGSGKRKINSQRQSLAAAEEEGLDPEALAALRASRRSARNTAERFPGSGGGGNSRKPSRPASSSLSVSGGSGDGGGDGGDADDEALLDDSVPLVPDLDEEGNPLFLPPEGSESWSAEEKRAYRESDAGIQRQKMLLTMHAEGSLARTEFAWAMRKEEVKEEELLAEALGKKVLKEGKKEELSLQAEEKRRLAEARKLEKALDDARAFEAKQARAREAKENARRAEAERKAAQALRRKARADLHAQRVADALARGEAPPPEEPDSEEEEEEIVVTRRGARVAKKKPAKDAAALAAAAASKAASIAAAEKLAAEKSAAAAAAAEKKALARRGVEEAFGVATEVGPDGKRRPAPRPSSVSVAGSPMHGSGVKSKPNSAGMLSPLASPSYSPPSRGGSAAASPNFGALLSPVGAIASAQGSPLISSRTPRANHALLFRMAANDELETVQGQESAAAAWEREQEELNRTPPPQIEIKLENLEPEQNSDDEFAEILASAVPSEHASEDEGVGEGEKPAAGESNPTSLPNTARRAARVPLPQPSEEEDEDLFFEDDLPLKSVDDILGGADVVDDDEEPEAGEEGEEEEYEGAPTPPTEPDDDEPVAAGDGKPAADNEVTSTVAKPGSLPSSPKPAQSSKRSSAAKPKQPEAPAVAPKSPSPNADTRKLAAPVAAAAAGRRGSVVVAAEVAVPKASSPVRPAPKRATIRGASSPSPVVSPTSPVRRVRAVGGAASPPPPSKGSRRSPAAAGRRGKKDDFTLETDQYVPSDDDEQAEVSGWDAEPPEDENVGLPVVVAVPQNLSAATAAEPATNKRTSQAARKKPVPTTYFKHAPAVTKQLPAAMTAAPIEKPQSEEEDEPKQDVPPLIVTQLSRPASAVGGPAATASSRSRLSSAGSTLLSRRSGLGLVVDGDENQAAADLAQEDADDATMRAEEALADAQADAQAAGFTARSSAKLSRAASALASARAASAALSAASSRPGTVPTHPEFYSLPPGAPMILVTGFAAPERKEKRVASPREWSAADELAEAERVAAAAEQHASVAAARAVPVRVAKPAAPEPEPFVRVPEPVDHAASALRATQAAAKEAAEASRRADEALYANVQERLLDARRADMSRRLALASELSEAQQVAANKRSWNLWEVSHKQGSKLAQRMGLFHARLAEVQAEKTALAAQLARSVALEDAEAKRKRLQAQQRVADAARLAHELHMAANEERRAEREAKFLADSQHKIDEARSGLVSPTAGKRAQARAAFLASQAENHAAEQRAKDAARREKFERFQAEWARTQNERWAREVERFRALQQRQAALTKHLARKRGAPGEEKESTAENGENAAPIAASELVQCSTPARASNSVSIALAAMLDPSFEPSGAVETAPVAMADGGAELPPGLEPIVETEEEVWHPPSQPGESSRRKAQQELAAARGAQQLQQAQKQHLEQQPQEHSEQPPSEAVVAADADATREEQESAHAAPVATESVAEEIPVEPTAPALTPEQQQEVNEKEAQKQWITQLMEQAKHDAQLRRQARQQRQQAQQSQPQHPRSAAHEEPAAVSSSKPSRARGAKLAAPGTLASLIPAPQAQEDRESVLGIKALSKKQSATLGSSASAPLLHTTATPRVRPLTAEEKARILADVAAADARAAALHSPPPAATALSARSAAAATSGIAGSTSLSSPLASRSGDISTLTSVLSAQNILVEERTPTDVAQGLVQPSPTSAAVQAARREEKLAAQESQRREMERRRREMDAGMSPSADDCDGQLMDIAPAPGSALAARAALGAEHASENGAGGGAGNSLFRGSSIDDWLAYINRGKYERMHSLAEEYSSLQKQKRQLMAERFKQFKNQQEAREEKIALSIASQQEQREEEEWRQAGDQAPQPGTAVTDRDRPGHIANPVVVTSAAAVGTPAAAAAVRSSRSPPRARSPTRDQRDLSPPRSSQIPLAGQASTATGLMFTPSPAAAEVSGDQTFSPNSTQAVAHSVLGLQGMKALPASRANALFQGALASPASPTRPLSEQGEARSTVFFTQTTPITRGLNPLSPTPAAASAKSSKPRATGALVPPAHLYHSPSAPTLLQAAEAGPSEAHWTPSNPFSLPAPPPAPVAPPSNQRSSGKVSHAPASLARKTAPRHAPPASDLITAAADAAPVIALSDTPLPLEPRPAGRRTNHANPHLARAHSPARIAADLAAAANALLMPKAVGTAIAGAGRPQTASIGALHTGTASHAQPHSQAQSSSHTPQQQLSGRKLLPLDGVSQPSPGRSLAASASAPALGLHGRSDSSHSVRSNASHASGNSSTRSPSHSPPLGAMGSPQSLRSSPRATMLQPLTDAPQVPSPAVLSASPLRRVASMREESKEPSTGASGALSPLLSPTSSGGGGSNVAALLSANRALRTQADGTRGSHSIPSKNSKAVFVLEPTARPSQQQSQHAQQSSQGEAMSPPAGAKGAALREAMRARAREEDLRQSGVLFAATSASFAHPRAAAPHVAPTSATSHASFGAPFSIPRLLPPPHRPSPVKMLMQAGSGYVAGGHEGTASALASPPGKADGHTQAPGKAAFGMPKRAL